MGPSPIERTSKVHAPRTRTFLATSALLAFASACGSRAATQAKDPPKQPTTTVSTTPNTNGKATAAVTTAPATTVTPTTATATQVTVTTAREVGAPPGPALATVPAGLPTDLPLPALSLRSSSITDGFTLRYTSTRSTQDLAIYEKILDKAGYNKTGEVDALDGQQHSLTITARKGAVRVEASAYGPEAAEGGDYLDVLVTIGG
jgi:hypothetical protein